MKRSWLLSHRSDLKTSQVGRFCRGCIRHAENALSLSASTESDDDATNDHSQSESVADILHNLDIDDVHVEQSESNTQVSASVLDVCKDLIHQMTRHQRSEIAQLLAQIERDDIAIQKNSMQSAKDCQVLRV